MHKAELKYDLEAQNTSARSLIPVRSTINALSMSDVVALVMVYDGWVTPNLSVWPLNQPADVSKIHSDMTLGWQDQRAQGSLKKKSRPIVVRLWRAAADALHGAGGRRQLQQTHPGPS